MTYQELLVSGQSREKLSYCELLSTTEWHDKRNKILERDGHICILCGCEERKLHPLSKDEINQQLLLNSIKRDMMKNDELHLKLPIAVAKYPQFSRNLHIHHKYYISGFLPWEYEEECLETLCADCHFKIHNETIICIYTDKSMLKMVESKTPCYRCNGEGFIEEYRRVQNGICFHCRGNKFEEYA